jgi:arylformamidase
MVGSGGIYKEDNMKIHDISMSIHKDMPVYKGRDFKRPIISVDSDFKTGASAYESRLEMNLHTGTHLDRPLHMIEGGETLDTFRLEQVVTDCKVFDLTHVSDGISKEDLEDKDIQKDDFIILKTKNSFEDILETDFIFVDKTGAAYLTEKGIKGVGIDSLGIERSQPNHETHKTLLGADIVILEGLELRDIEEGEYFLVAVPIKIAGVEAAPVRAILIEK